MILLIDNYDSFTYNLYQYLCLSHSDVKVVRNDQLTLEDIASMGVEGIVISPGPGHPKDAGICVELIRHFSAKIPLLGVCLGYQAMVEAFGGDVIHANEIMHGKQSVISHDGSLLYQNMDERVTVGRYHSLMAKPSTLPEVFTVTAQTDNGVIMSIQHKTDPTYGVQYHPESILTVDGEKILRNFIDLCVQRAGKKP